MVRVDGGEVHYGFSGGVQSLDSEDDVLFLFGSGGFSECDSDDIRAA